MKKVIRHRDPGSSFRCYCCPFLDIILPFDTAGFGHALSGPWSLYPPSQLGLISVNAVLLIYSYLAWSYRNTYAVVLIVPHPTRGDLGRPTYSIDYRSKPFGNGRSRSIYDNCGTHDEQYRSGAGSRRLVVRDTRPDIST